jgi:hypothetical protein
MRRIGLALSTLLLAANAGIGDEKNGDVPLKEIDITLPKAISNIKYDGRQEYDQKELGYMVGFKNRMCSISLYVYDGGNKAIPDGKEGELVAKELKQALEDIRTAEKKGIIKTVKAMEGELALPKGVKSSFATAGVTFDVDGGGCKSYVLLVGRSNHFLKLRVTQYVVDEKTNDDEVNAFLEKVVEQLK